MRTRAKVNRTVVFMLGLIESVIFICPFNGWSSLVSVLVADGIASDKCRTGHFSASIITDNGHVLFGNTTLPQYNLYTSNISTSQITCAERDAHWSLIYTVTIVIFMLISLPFGCFFDRFGLLASRLLASCFFVAGCLFLAFTTPETQVMVYPGMILLGVSGAITTITVTQIGNLFKGFRSTALGAYNGAADASVIVFHLIKEANAAGISRKSSFIFLAGLTVLPVFTSLFLLPRYKIEHQLESQRVGEDLSVHVEEPCEQIPLSNEQDVNSKPAVEQDKDGILKDNVSLRMCICSTYMILCIIWAVLLALRHYTFFRFQSNILAHYNPDKATANKVSRISSFILFGGIVLGLIAGSFIDYHMKKRTELYKFAFRPAIASVLPLSVASFCFTALSITRLFPALACQYITVSLLLVGRAFLFSTLCGYMYLTFPSRYYGTLWGLTYFMIGISQFSQYALFAWTKGPPYDPNKALYLLLGISVLSFIHPVTTCIKHFKIFGRHQKKHSSHFMR